VSNIKENNHKTILIHNKTDTIDNLLASYCVIKKEIFSAKIGILCYLLSLSAIKTEIFADLVKFINLIKDCLEIIKPTQY